MQVAARVGSALDERLRDQLVQGINYKTGREERLRQHTDIKYTLKDVEAYVLVLERAVKTQKSNTMSRADDHILYVNKPSDGNKRQNQANKR